MVSGNDVFIRYLSEAIGADNASVALSALTGPASVSVRINPFKKCAEFRNSRRVPWSEYGLLLDDRPSFTLDPFFHAGCYYVQDSSSMFIGYILRCLLENFRTDRQIRVLDLCAAPGGKTTDAAASLRKAFGDGFLLVSNEVMRSRASVLADNVALWGDPLVAVTSSDPAAFGRTDGFFDIIIADVPCSGEGMFRKDEEAVRQWSAENVAHCAARQRRILADSWPSLAENGFLIYSTCTFNKFENDDNVRWAAENLGAEIQYPDRGRIPDGVIPTACGYSLVPGFVEGEGQYCAVLKKTASQPRREFLHGKKRQAASIVAGLFGIPVREERKGDLVKAVPESVADELDYLGNHVRILSSGCAAGTLKGKDLVPSADLALNIALKDGTFRKAEVDRRTALKFLHRDALSLPDENKGYIKGYILVCHEGVPLGFVKNLGSRCNNLHPQERRIRMDVND